VQLNAKLVKKSLKNVLLVMKTDLSHQVVIVLKVIMKKVLNVKYVVIDVHLVIKRIIVPNVQMPE